MIYVLWFLKQINDSRYCGAFPAAGSAGSVCVRRQQEICLIKVAQTGTSFFLYLCSFIYSNKSDDLDQRTASRVNTGKVCEVGIKRSWVKLWCRGLWLLYRHECLLKLWRTSWIMTFEPCTVILLNLVPTGSKKTPSMWTWQAWWLREVVQGHGWICLFCTADLDKGTVRGSKVFPSNIKVTKYWAVVVTSPIFCQHNILAVWLLALSEKNLWKKGWVLHSLFFSSCWLPMFSNSSLLYLKLTLSTKEGVSQKEVGGWKSSKGREPWSRRR